MKRANRELRIIRLLAKASGRSSSPGRETKNPSKPSVKRRKNKSQNSQGNLSNGRVKTINSRRKGSLRNHSRKRSRSSNRRAAKKMFTRPAVAAEWGLATGMVKATKPVYLYSGGYGMQFQYRYRIEASMGYWSYESIDQFVTTNLSLVTPNIGISYKHTVSPTLSFSGGGGMFYGILFIRTMVENIDESKKEAVWSTSSPGMRAHARVNYLLKKVEIHAELRRPYYFDKSFSVIQSTDFVVGIRYFLPQ